MVSHSTEQQYDIIRKPESVSIFFSPFGDLLKTLMFLSNLNGFNSSPSPPDQGFAKWKCSSKVWKEKSSNWSSHFFLSPSNFLFALLVCFAFLFLSQFSFYDVLCLKFFVCLFSILLYFFFFKKKKEKTKKQKQCMFMYIGSCVP